MPIRFLKVQTLLRGLSSAARTVASKLSRLAAFAALVVLVVVAGAPTPATAQTTDHPLTKAAAAAPASCGFALDSQGQVSAGSKAELTGSGVLFARYALGLSGQALIAGTHIDQTPANRATIIAAINAHMAAFSGAHDVDGSGPPIGVNDAIIIARYLAGFRGESLVAGLTLSPNSTRKTGTAIETYIASGCPVTITPPTSLPLTCTLFGPAVIPLASTGSVSATCTSTAPLSPGSPLHGRSAVSSPTPHPPPAAHPPASPASSTA